MKKRTIAVLAFVAMLVLGLGIVQTTVSAVSGWDCHCFNEPAAESMCEDLCQHYTGTGCLEAGPNGLGDCVNEDQCYTLFWSYCQNGSQFRRGLSEYCFECIDF